jgi:hypothetical protein
MDRDPSHYGLERARPVKVPVYRGIGLVVPAPPKLRRPVHQRASGRFHAEAGHSIFCNARLSKAQEEKPSS